MKWTTRLVLAMVLGMGAGIPPAASAAESVKIEVMYTSDIHGGISKSRGTFLNPQFPPPIGGGASAATYIGKVREQAEKLGRPVFLFDSGDIFQGTLVGKRTEGQAVVEWMNEVGYTASALGNHDFDLGWEVTQRMLQTANFPMMALNVYEAGTDKRVSWMDGPLFTEAHGIKIAVLGYCTESTVNMALDKNIEGLEFRPVHEEIAKDVPWARQEGADLVIVLMHVGLPWYPEHQKEYSLMVERAEAGELPHANMNAMEIAYTIPGIDLIFAGHTHTGYNEPWEDPVNHTIVFEPFANGSSIGHVTLELDPRTKSIMGYETHTGRGALVTLFEEEHWPDHAMDEVIGAKVAVVEEGMQDVVGETEVYLDRRSSEAGLMGFVVADAHRDACNADFAIQNTGGVRADLPIGRITEKDLFEVSPFDNQLMSISMKGSMLKQILEDKVSTRGFSLFISGGKIRFDPTRPEGDRIIDFRIGGEPYDPDRVYTVAMTNYLATGNSGLWRVRDEIPDSDKVVMGTSDFTALVEYVRKLGVIRMRNDGRVVRVDPS